MRSDDPDFDRGFETGLERDLDTQLRLFFRQAARPAAPLALERAIERLPDRVFRDRIGLPGRHLLVRPMKAALVALSMLLAVAIAAGLLDLRGGSYSAPAAHGTATRVPLTPVSRDPMILAMGRFDSNTGWVEINALEADDSGRPSYLRWTADGGKTWSERRPVPQPLTDMGTGEIQFVDTSHGWTVTYGPQGSPTQKATLWRTSDGGLTWQTSTIPFDTVSSSGFLGDTFHFRDPLNGEAFEFRAASTGSDAAAGPKFSDWVCKQFSTSDGGVTWSAPRPATCMVGVTFVNPMLGYAYDYSGSPVLYVTLDGGRTWTSGTLPLNGQGSSWTYWPMLVERRSDGTLRALVAWSGETGPYVIVVSTDAGRTWSMAGTVSAGDATTRDYGLPLGMPIAVRDENNWLTAPIKLGNEPDPWFGTGDGGLTWTHVTYAGLTGDIKDFDFLNASDGWAATDTYDTVAALWSTKDGGATWTRILSTP